MILVGLFIGFIAMGPIALSLMVSWDKHSCFLIDEDENVDKIMIKNLYTLQKIYPTLPHWVLNAVSVIHDNNNCYYDYVI